MTDAAIARADTGGGHVKRLLRWLTRSQPTHPSWDELIWGRDGQTYDPEADAAYTDLHRGDQGIQG